MRKARLPERGSCRRNRIFRRQFAGSAACFLAAWLAGGEPLVAFQTPLSEEAVREAYFLGQRHDESVTRALEKYSQYFAIPDRGPQIASVTYLTPFAQAILASSNHAGNYSAQQAQIAHRGLHETVQIQVAIRFTDSYPALIPSAPPASHGARSGLVPRSSDFWRDFEITVFDGDKAMEPASQEGRPDYTCNENSCFLIGATVLLDFPADDFTSQDVTVEVDPPEGQPFVAGLDLANLR